MIHNHVDSDPTSSAHWSVGTSLPPDGADRALARVLAQISNARGDQVRLALTASEAETLAAALYLVADATVSVSLRAGSHSDRPEDGWWVHSVDEGRVRIDFHWDRAFTAVNLSRNQARAFANGITETAIRITSEAAASMVSAA